MTGPGFEVHTTPIILINALGFVGFKLLGVAGTREVRIGKQRSLFLVRETHQKVVKRG